MMRLVLYGMGKTLAKGFFLLLIICTYEATTIMVIIRHVYTIVCLSLYTTIAYTLHYTTVFDECLAIMASPRIS